MMARAPSRSPASWQPVERLPWRHGLPYGLLGAPLAFVALPLYVLLPNHYASAFGVPLAALGGVLLAARLLDAVADPLIGRAVDRLFARSWVAAWRLAVLAGVLLAAGFALLFFPGVRGTTALLVWCGALLAVTYVAYSFVSVFHQSWGARLGGDESMRARIVAWRESLALVGVLTASVLPAVGGLGATTVVFTLLLAGGLGCLAQAPHPRSSGSDGGTVDLRLPLRQGPFRRLLAVFVVNGIASAIPATLVLFFIRDRLQAPSFEPLFLGLYFGAAALSMPLWVRIVEAAGLARAWLGGMLLAVGTFAWAAWLGAGDAAAFATVCIASGLALGADLGLPPAMLVGVIQRARHAGWAEGAYFGWWNFATKLNLAVAAGVALPALQWLGYAPGSRDPAALDALTLAYCAIPCALKLLAAGLLWQTSVAKEFR